MTQQKHEISPSVLSLTIDSPVEKGRKEILRPVATDELKLRFVAETALSAKDHAAISTLLIAAFPQFADIFGAASWYGG